MYYIHINKLYIFIYRKIYILYTTFILNAVSLMDLNAGVCPLSVKGDIEEHSP